jgi:2-keto-4-pentenoate hydratase/2-oxohepta-3-ene-1,7-dioic acid hydratase in catechol pathway
MIEKLRICCCIGGKRDALAGQARPGKRDYSSQPPSSSSVARKAFDTFCPVGPWIVTEDEIGEAASALQGTLWVNGEVKQDANTRDLVLDIPGMIEMASSIMTLYPGDIIATGTPAGVGPIRPGDTVKITFERIGSMTLDVVQGETGRHSIFAVPPGQGA